jgi:hypothetical protein
VRECGPFSFQPVTINKEDISMSNITPGHVRVFQAIRSQLYENITLASCTINNEPGVAIVMIDEVGEGKIAVMPLVVGITPGMKTRHSGRDGIRRRRGRSQNAA